MTSSINNVQSKNLINVINNYTINNIAKYLGGNDVKLENIDLIYNNPLTVNDYINKDNNEDNITCIINLTDYKMSDRYDLFYPLQNNKIVDFDEYNKLTSQEKINPLNGCLKLYPMLDKATDWINCPTNYGDIVFINSSIFCKYNMNHGISPMKSLHIRFKKINL